MSVASISLTVVLNLQRKKRKVEPPEQLIVVSKVPASRRDGREAAMAALQTHLPPCVSGSRVRALALYAALAVAGFALGRLVRGRFSG